MDKEGKMYFTRKSRIWLWSLASAMAVIVTVLFCQYLHPFGFGGAVLIWLIICACFGVTLRLTFPKILHALYEPKAGKELDKSEKII